MLTLLLNVCHFKNASALITRDLQLTETLIPAFFTLSLSPKCYLLLLLQQQQLLLLQQLFALPVIFSF